MACRNVFLLIGLGWYEIEEASRANKTLEAFGASISVYAVMHTRIPLRCNDAEAETESKCVDFWW